MATEQRMLREGALKDRVIVVTGGGTGLGRSMAEAFLELGASVCITSRKMEVLETTARELEEATGGKVLPVACDIRKYAEVEALVKAVHDRFGRCDGLVNNAAGNFISPTERLTSKAFEVIIDIVLMGTVNCTMAFGKHWIDAKERDKAVLNIVTTYAWTGSGYVVPSACAKAGVLALTRSLAVEWAKYGIRSNAIAPGPFPTKGAWSRLLPGELIERFDMAKKVPLGRMGEHHELADLVTYLMSPFAGYINGEVVTIDGGEWLQGAGQFNMLEAVEPGMWDAIEAMVRKVRGS
ncbi:MAG: SDR family oxidoreductase [Flavobacteriales bacterium]|nr:SDR family oxidoreductase [Flavobacteriales bacterium]MCB0788140.1 SDR family oxidoreductase [Flavobacteriales bacterium]MCB0809773.1 SDR family oxidoreductase [Flavobacteriales bacterium]MCB0818414.1 SDR family oxidoreductase [Flavobacteriales bacterium]MCB9180526.1 SDR family oxidoreductase [Flavobacteriales bacterium]